MSLVEHQMKMLLALFRDAFAQGAKSLSDLTPLPVTLEVIKLELYTLPQLEVALSRYMQDSHIATIHQSFAGAIQGEGFWLLSYTDALQLTSTLSGFRMQFTQLDQSAREVLCEMGNMGLNSVLGVMGNLLHHIPTSSVPHLYVDSQKALLNSILTTREQYQTLLAPIMFRQGALAFCMLLMLVCEPASLRVVAQSIK